MSGDFYGDDFFAPRMRKQQRLHRAAARGVKARALQILEDKEKKEKPARSAKRERRTLPLAKIARIRKRVDQVRRPYDFFATREQDTVRPVISDDSFDPESLDLDPSAALKYPGVPENLEVIVEESTGLEQHIEQQVAPPTRAELELVGAPYRVGEAQRYADDLEAAVPNDPSVYPAAPWQVGANSPYNHDAGEAPASLGAWPSVTVLGIKIDSKIAADTLKSKVDKAEAKLKKLDVKRLDALKKKHAAQYATASTLYKEISESAGSEAVKAATWTAAAEYWLDKVEDEISKVQKEQAVAAAKVMPLPTAAKVGIGLSVPLAIGGLAVGALMLAKRRQPRGR